MADQTILGCPASSYLALVSACSATAVPTCATAVPVVYDSACCGSIASFGTSLAACYAKSAPACFNTSAALAAASSLTSVELTNPCASFLGAATASPTKPATSSAHTTAAGKTSGSAASVATSASSASGSVAATTAKPNSAVGNVGTGLKVYIGFALVGALAVLNL